MSKYKAGDKFIIEIDSHMTRMCRDLYGIKGFRSLVFDDLGLNKLVRYEKDNANYNAGYEEGLNTGYEEGLNDAWRCARKIVESDCGTQYVTFGEHFSTEVFRLYSASGAMRKMEEYEEKQNEIKIGDEVNAGQDGNGIVIGATEENYLVWKVDITGGDFHEACWYGRSRVSKTGRHFDIECIIEGTKGE